MVVVLEFKRSPQWFFDVIVHGPLLDKHRLAMLTVGRPCWFAADAKIIARPEEVIDILGDFLGADHFGIGSLRALNSLGWGALPPPRLVFLSSLGGSSVRQSKILARKLPPSKSDAQRATTEIPDSSTLRSTMFCFTSTFTTSFSTMATRSRGRA
jgi:hypothetical protein